jgi:hypothetical protein
MKPVEFSWGWSGLMETYLMISALIVAIMVRYHIRKQRGKVKPPRR